MSVVDFELSLEEQQEIEDDPDANENEFSDFGTGINSIRADQALSEADQAVRNTNVSPTPTFYLKFYFICIDYINPCPVTHSDACPTRSYRTEDPNCCHSAGTPDAAYPHSPSYTIS